MDIDKLKQWMDIAQNMHGGDFWKNVLDQEFAKQFINDQNFNSSFSGFENHSARSETASRQEQSSKNEQAARTFPLIDIIEGDLEVLVLIELPGIPKEKIELGLNGNVLSIKGVSMPLHQNLNPTYSERFYGEFQRQIKLPDTVSPNELSAKFWNGILFVSYKRSLENIEIIPID
jgi:HSP20 family protein